MSIEDICSRVGEKIIDIYNQKSSSKLIFPTTRTTPHKIRVSEQEARFMFANEVVNSDYNYAIEVPTEHTYSGFSSKLSKDLNNPNLRIKPKPRIHLKGEKIKGNKGRSASIDMSLYENKKQVVNIEFKKGQPPIHSITKDLLKLLFEKSQKGIFYHILEHSNKRGVTSFLDKFNEASKNSEIVKTLKKIKYRKILLFIVKLDDGKCIGKWCNFSKNGVIFKDISN
jgi:hypothetical protein